MKAKADEKIKVFGARLVQALALLTIAIGGGPMAQAACLAGGYSLDVENLMDVVPHPTDVDTLYSIQNPVGPDGVALLKSCGNGSTWSATALTTDFYTVTSLAIALTDGESAYAMANRGPLVSSD